MISFSKKIHWPHWWMSEVWPYVFDFFTFVLFIIVNENIPIPSPHFLTFIFILGWKQEIQQSNRFYFSFTHMKEDKSITYINEFGESQWKFCVRIDYMELIIEYYVFYYYLWIVCYTFLNLQNSKCKIGVQIYSKCMYIYMHTFFWSASRNLLC